MDFAKKELEKYGWKEGAGLGKNEDGIKIAIKPTLKFDNAGVGHDPGAEFKNFWWEETLMQALNNIAVNVDVESNSEVEPTTVPAVDLSCYAIPTIGAGAHSPLTVKRGYNAFIKTSRLSGSGIVEDFKPTVPHSSPATITSGSFLHNDIVIQALGGNTGHPSQRFGLMKGKLSRLEKFDKLVQTINMKDYKKKSDKLQEKNRKLKEKKDKYMLILEKKMLKWNISDKTKDVPEEDYTSPLLRKKHKAKRSVSFNETVTKYILPPDPESNSNSSSKDENGNRLEAVAAVSGGNSDEGIEIDLSNAEASTSSADGEPEPTMRSLFKYNDLSKAERKKLKKKREYGEHRATNVFLQQMNISVASPMAEAETDDPGYKKRKFVFDVEDCEARKCRVKNKERELEMIRNLFQQHRHDRAEKMKTWRKKMQSMKKYRDQAIVNSITESLVKQCTISGDK